MLRTRVSTLEAYRRCIETSYGDEQELALAIQGQPSPPRWQMARGTELHRLLASEDHNVVRYGVEHNGEPSRYRFPGSDVLACRAMVGEGLCEVPGIRLFSAPVVAWCEVTGQADWVWGKVIQDHKCVTSAPDPRSYEASLQWRFYLLIHGCDVFRYNLFWFDEPEEKPDGSLWSRLKEITTVSFWRYPGLERDCTELLYRFLEWAEAKGLLPFLEVE